MTKERAEKQTEEDGVRLDELTQCARNDKTDVGLPHSQILYARPFILLLSVFFSQER